LASGIVTGILFVALMMFLDIITASNICLIVGILIIGKVVSARHDLDLVPVIVAMIIAQIVLALVLVALGIVMAIIIIFVLGASLGLFGM